MLLRQRQRVVGLLAGEAGGAGGISSRRHLTRSSVNFSEHVSQGAHGAVGCFASCESAGIAAGSTGRDGSGCSDVEHALMLHISSAAISFIAGTGDGCDMGNLLLRGVAPLFLGALGGFRFARLSFGLGYQGRVLGLQVSQLGPHAPSVRLPTANGSGDDRRGHHGAQDGPG